MKWLDSVLCVQAPPSMQLACRLGLPTCTDIVLSSSAYSSHAGTLSFVRSLPTNASWSIVKHDALASSVKPTQSSEYTDMLAVGTAISHLQQATWLDRQYSPALLE